MIRKSVAIFIPSLVGGGAERAAVSFANGLCERGHRVDLVLCVAEGPYLAQVVEGVRIVDLGTTRTIRSVLPLASYLRERAPDVLVSSLPHANIAATLARKASGSSARLVLMEQADPSRHTSSLRGLGLLLLMGVFYRLADRIIACSNGVRDQLSRLLLLSSGGVSVLYNPIDLSEIRRRSSEDCPIPRFGDRGEDPWSVIAVGRLVPEKDFATLLSAFAEVRKRANARLFILGEGPLRHSLQALARNLSIQDDVEFAGFISNPYAVMSRADTLVLSSRTEGLPTVLIEGLVCGAQVVSTDCGTGPAEILEDGRHGEIVPVGAPLAMSEAILRSFRRATKVPDGSLDRFLPERQILQFEQVLFG